MPELYYLVAEYYAPEFARKSDGDVGKSIFADWTGKATKVTIPE